MLLDPAFPQKVRDFCARQGISPLTLGQKVFGNTYMVDAMDRALARLVARTEALQAAMDEVEPPPVYAHIELTVTTPQSTNKLFVHGKDGKRHATKEYTAWQKLAGQEIIAQCAQWRFKQVPVGPYILGLRLPEADRADIDNRTKSVIDLLVKANITPDDKKLRRLIVERDEAVAPGTCEVNIWSLVPA